MLAGIVQKSELEWEVPLGFVPGMRVCGKFYLSASLGDSL